MANYNQLNTIGSGAYFPIKLEQALGSDGKPESVQLPDGRVVPKIGWYRGCCFNKAESHSYPNLSDRPKVQARGLWFSNLGMFGRT